ncbi:hypothetical protein WCNC_01605 [Weissella ceti NC36]|nr:hypothetical protein WCNC_01605 [Weissella ceti NC36]
MIQKRKGCLLMTSIGLAMIISVATCLLLPIKQHEMLIVRDKRQYLEKQAQQLQAIRHERAKGNASKQALSEP